MTAIPSTSRASGLQGASMVLLGLAAALVVVDAVASVLAGFVERSPAVFITFTIAMVGTVVAGAVLVREPRHSGLGRLLLGIAATAAVQDLVLTFPTVGLALFAWGFVHVLLVALIVHLIVRWPDSRVSGRIARALVFAAYVVPLVLTAIWQLTWSPRWWEGEHRTRAWITVVPAQDFSAAAWQSQQVILIALEAALLALIAVRVIRSRGARFKVLLPVAVAAFALAAVDVLSILSVSQVDLDLLSNVALLAVPVAVLLAVVRAPAEIDAPTTPGRRSSLDQRARDRYQLGMAGAGAAIVVLVAVVVGVSSALPEQDPSDPQPGPALVAP